jgi:hypothetical protein
MRTGLLPVAGMFVALPPAAAQDVKVEPVAEARLRYETVAQDDLPLESDAVTMRVRSGVRATVGRWSGLMQGEATVALADGYFDGLDGDRRRPMIADPENIELHQGYLSYAIPKRLTATLGRQELALANQRFVGANRFRQNGQSFDALRVQWTPLPRVSADVSYAWSVRTINGIDGRDARQQAVSGDNVFALLGYRSGIGTVTAFAYLVDQDESAVQGYRLSNQSYGVRLAGSRTIAPAWKADYAAQWARQSDYHRNPNRYAAEQWSAEGTLTHKAVGVLLGHEVLGASSAQALTSFQTPLSAAFGFQGWADKFTTTPPDGIRDSYAGALGNWRTHGLIDGVGVQAVWHRFESDRLVRHYGDEWNLLATARLGHTEVSVRYARYLAERVAADTRKVWLSAEWAL